MSMNIIGIACYGVQLKEDSAPWRIDESFECDIEEWWLKVTGFERPHKLWSDDRLLVDEYRRQAGENWHAKKSWLETHPLPVTEVVIGHYDYPVIVIAAPETVQLADWVQPLNLEMSREMTFNSLYQRISDFVETYGLDTEGEIGWLLGAGVS